MFPIFSERWERSIYSYQRINCRCSSLINCPTFFNAQWTGLEKPWPMGSRWRCSPRIQFSKIAWVIPQVIPRFHHPGLQHVPIWWFGTWLALKKSISFFWHSRGMSSFPLTNSIIFQDGHIAPPTSHISPSNSPWYLFLESTIGLRWCRRAFIGCVFAPLRVGGVAWPCFQGWLEFPAIYPLVNHHF